MKSLIYLSLHNRRFWGVRATSAEREGSREEARKSGTVRSRYRLLRFSGYVVTCRKKLKRGADVLHVYDHYEFNIRAKIILFKNINNWTELIMFRRMLLAIPIVSLHSTARGGVLPYMGYIGMCRPIGYGFWGSRSLNRVSFLLLSAKRPWRSP